MSHPVTILGIGADGRAGISARALAALAAANFVAGGRRQLQLVAPCPAETFTLTNNVAELVTRLRQREPEERWVVLGSGDPLFYGIGHALSDALGRDQIVVEPALSSMQLAFARVGVAWHDAAIASIHGRPLAKTLMPLLGKRSVGLFTQDGASPAAVASFFLERGLGDYDVWVAESLGAADERVTALSLAELVGRSFGDLNVLILQRRATATAPLIDCEVPGLPDALFAQPDSGPVLLTHADVRAVTLSRFRDLPEGSIWDLGAGLGGVSIELARALPAREIVAVERSVKQRAYLQANRLRFSAFNIRIVAGEAPEALSDEEPPAAVFLGGTGGRLDAILDLTLRSIVAGGILVANFVSLENLARSLSRLHDAGWPTGVTQVLVATGQPLAGLTVMEPQRPVWVVRATRPG